MGACGCFYQLPHVADQSAATAEIILGLSYAVNNLLSVFIGGVGMPMFILGRLLLVILHVCV
jgi:hypothetical protein